MKNAVGAHLRELALAEQMAGRFVEQATGDDEIRFTQQVLERDLAGAEVTELDVVRVRIVGDQPQVERPRHPQQLLADAAGADDAERSPA